MMLSSCHSALQRVFETSAVETDLLYARQVGTEDVRNGTTLSPLTLLLLHRSTRLSSRKRSPKAGTSGAWHVDISPLSIDAGMLIVFSIQTVSHHASQTAENSGPYGLR
jgi:hypothetical protein